MKAREQMKTKAVTLWLHPETIEALHAEAARYEIKISAAAETLLQEGLRRHAAEQLEQMAMPAIAAAVRQIVAEQAGHTEARLARLLGGIALDSGVARRVTTMHARHALKEEARADLVNAVDDAVTTLAERGLPRPPATLAAG